MRSSKSRSRNKSNRNRSGPVGGNIVNRVFDSSGPEGKVRGTPQQIIEKYNQLARDAQLGNDRVAAENFQQHAEHYLRMLSEAQREQEQRREQQEQENRQRQAERDRERPQRQDRNQNDTSNEASTDEQPQPQQPQPQAGRSEVEPRDGKVLNVVDANDTGDNNGLVETPEDKPAKRSYVRKPRAPKAKAKASDDSKPDEGSTPAAAE
ncbi:DUF4167 domain-containing protein [Pseudooceanicola sp.]|uniref:DUF4167 domain-containing protein n=1 Tax=Pseudooceanicola sp. TaxID=1914328 RepID=UPI00260289B0|nr:DUF4167 domain-containing protein [Pseudooceanicola sp.]MDF1854158.1 DUF4167 domain-containing protein [Pseudooceanicola sp.]